MKGAPAKPMSATSLPASSCAHQADRVGDVRRVGRGLEGPQAGEVGRAAERLGHDRPPARLDVDAEADGVDRHHDVGEENGGVDAVAADRLQRQLGGQRRRRRWRRGSSPSPRAARYSGSDRPAWRMNHTGVRDTGWRKQARTRSVPASAAGLTRAAL